MAPASFRQLYKQMLLRRLYQPDPLPNRPAVVFAPHQDDETLGCGGTIAQKRNAGVPVWIVFLTDGSKSHRGLVSADDLRAMRMQEARDAGQVLGVPQENIRFFEFPNGGLKNVRPQAQEKAAALLRDIQPAEIYIPSAWDFHYEHRITNEIIQGALAMLRGGSGLPHAVQVFEYPVWFWHQWPWVDWRSADAKEQSDLIKRTLRYGFGLAMLKEFNYAVPVRDSLGCKRAALEQYRSQTTRLSDDASWKTLQDVASGEFLACFFQDYEVFRTRKIVPAAAGM